MNKHFTLFAFIVVFVASASARALALPVNDDKICLETGDDPKAYPNPFKGKITINHGACDKIEICTLLGEVVRTVHVGANDKSTQLDLSELKKGVYFYVIRDNNSILETRRIIKSE